MASVDGGPGSGTDRDTEPDLFCALRGGGDFGLVTAREFRLLMANPPRRVYLRLRRYQATRLRRR